MIEWTDAHTINALLVLIFVLIVQVWALETRLVGWRNRARSK